LESQAQAVGSASAQPRRGRSTLLEAAKQQVKEMTPASSRQRARMVGIVPVPERRSVLVSTHTFAASLPPEISYAGSSYDQVAVPPELWRASSPAALIALRATSECA